MQKPNVPVVLCITTLTGMASNMSWQVQDIRSYNSFEMDGTQDTSLSVSLLIPLDNNHKTTGAFRLVVYGGDAESVPVAAGDLFKDLPDALKGTIPEPPVLNFKAQTPR
jgi:hypothetical protein